MANDNPSDSRYRGGSAAELAAAERIYLAWDDALGKKDLAASMALYTQDATLESLLVSHLLGTDAGIVEGRDNLRSFVRKVYDNPAPARQRYRNGYFSDGKRLVWEYPRVMPNGQQVDLIEMMELKDGLIHRHRVYWGWYGVKTLDRK